MSGPKSPHATGAVTVEVETIGSLSNLCPRTSHALVGALFSHLICFLFFSSRLVDGKSMKNHVNKTTMFKPIFWASPTRWLRLGQVRLWLLGRRVLAEDGIFGALQPLDIPGSGAESLVVELLEFGNKNSSDTIL